MDNRDFEQTTQAVSPEPETAASDTLETLNKLNAASRNPNMTTGNVLPVISGVLFFIAALAQLIYAVNNLTNFFQWISSWYATFSNTFPNILMFVGHLAAAGGFALAGASLIIKKNSIQLMRIAPLLMIGFCAFSAIADLIYLFSWESGLYFFYILIDIVYGLLWAAIAMIIFDIRPDLTKKISIAYIIVPSVLLTLQILFGISAGSFYNFGRVLIMIVEYAALIIVGVMIYIDSTKNETSEPYTYSSSGASEAEDYVSGSAYGEDTAPAYTAAAEPEGYTSIVKLVLLSIVTFGIYVYIWIYRVSGYTVKRSAQGPQSSQNVQLVLCLFVPFYIIYWMYKQCKAIEDIRIRSAGTGSEDLSLVCLLLNIFGFGIVAYALMQDQINKIVKPVPVPSYDFYPPPTQTEAPQGTPAGPAQEPAAQGSADDAAAVTDAQIETVKKLKALLDAGVLTQEEFDAKKKQVLGL